MGSVRDTDKVQWLYGLQPIQAARISFNVIPVILQIKHALPIPATIKNNTQILQPLQPFGWTQVQVHSGYSGWTLHQHMYLIFIPIADVHYIQDQSLFHATIVSLPACMT